jgi:hypothetical protein
MFDFTHVKLEIFIPGEHVPALGDALAAAGAGVIGNYDHCLSYAPVRGSWRPLPGADPYQGEIGRLYTGEEMRVEVNCPREIVPQALRAIRAVHPYEEPVINVIPLANHLFE